MAWSPAWSPIVDGVTEIDAEPINDIVDKVSDLDDTKADLEDVWRITANNQTGDYTLQLSDAGKVIEVNSASPQTVTVPPNSSVAFPVGSVVELYAMGAGTVTVAAGSGVTVRNAGALAAQYATASLRKRATDEWVLSGELA